MTDDKQTSEPAMPISFPVRVSTISKAGTAVTIVASEEQRASLAEFHDLVGVVSFEAAIKAETWQLDGVRLVGRVKAKIVQECVVTLEPVEAEIDQEIDLVLVPEAPVQKQPVLTNEVVIEAEGPDEPDTFSGDIVDAGAVALEFFALAIDPYPRRDGASIEATAPNRFDDERPSPFAKLAELKQPN